MALPLSPIPTTLGPDDVRSAELVDDVERFAADACDHFAREHVARGRAKGRHEVVVVYCAVARLDLTAIQSGIIGHPQPSDLRVEWAFGFSRLPRLMIGSHELFSGVQDQGVFLDWEISEGRTGYQTITVTPTWSGTGCPIKPMVRTSGRRGAILLGYLWMDPATERPAPHPDLVPIEGLTIGICAAPPRR